VIADAVARTGADPSATTSVILAAAEGMPRLESGAWRGLAACWHVATAAGAPLAAALRDYARSLRSLADAQRDAEVALAAPAATARLVMALPPVGVLFGAALGFDTFRTLFATPVGLACLAIGGALMLLASRWNRRLVRAAQPDSAVPGLDFELVAIAVGGGGSLSAARSAVDAALELCGLVVRPGEVDAVLELSRAAGVPAAELLRSEAEESRRAARASAQERAAALSVKLMLPLGLCVLPAFMVLGVIPLLIAVISSTVSTW
jgi:tight adherence protein B